MMRHVDTATDAKRTGLNRAEIPVVLFVYNRPQVLRRTLACLQRNRVPRLYAFSDGPRSEADRQPVDEVRSILRRIDWCRVELVERAENLGLGRSILRGMTDIFQRHEAAVVFEDDLVCVPGTYDYLCAALRHYRDDERVMSVTGWTHPRVTPAGVVDRPYFDGRAESLAWGAWARSWSGMTQDAWSLLQQCHRRGIDVFRYGADLPVTAKQELHKNVWAVRFLYWHLFRQGLCMRPPWSMVEHIGYGADATNTKQEEWFTNPPLRSAPVPPGSWPHPVEDPECPRLWQRIYGHPSAITQAGKPAPAPAAKEPAAADRVPPGPPPGGGDFDGRTVPRSRVFGLDRGLPIDRYYIEKFLQANRELIRGRVLEIGDSGYTRKFGRDVAQVDVLSVAEDPQATIVGDLATGENIPRGVYDCIILVQTLQMIYDVKAAVRHAADALRPCGALLATGSGISQISRYDMDRWGEYWRFTDRSLGSLLSEALPGGRVDVAAHGNLAVAKAFLEGLSMQELPADVLDVADPDYQVVITARAIKDGEGAPAAAGRPAAPPRTALPPAILLYHRVCDDASDAHLLSVSPQHFERHMHHLRSRFQVLPLGDLLDDIRRGRLRRNTVAITFDDGYADNLTHALPILEATGVPATVFVTSGMVGLTRAFWWDEVEQILLKQQRLPSELRIDGLTPEELRLDLQSRSARLQAHDRLCALLRNLAPAAIEAVLTRLRQWARTPADALVSHPALDAGQLQRLSASPLIDIGAHSVTHARLSSLPADEQREEIVTSRIQIESLTGNAVSWFSYPFGSASDFTVGTARRVAHEGYLAGVANIQGSIGLPAALFALPRRLVRDWTAEQFAAWLADPRAAGHFESLALRERRERLGREPAEAKRPPSRAPRAAAPCAGRRSPDSREVPAG